MQHNNNNNSLRLKTTHEPQAEEEQLDRPCSSEEKDNEVSHPY